MSVETIAAKTLAVAGPACAAAGYELVDVRFTMDQGNWVLRLFIDRIVEGDLPDLYEPSASMVDLSDCERISKEVSALLDVEDFIPQAYNLEVSSPGIDRPLRTAAHFRRVIGHEAKISLHEPIDGRKNFRGLVTAVHADGGRETVDMNCDGSKFTLPLSDIDQAKFLPDWDIVMRPGQRAAALAKEQKKSAKRNKSHHQESAESPETARK